MVDPFGTHSDSTAQRQLRAARRLKDLDHLPSLPQEQQSLLALVRDAEVDVDELVAALKRCPSVAARILSVARSAFFARRTPARGVRDAVVRVLGLRLVADLVCCMVLREPLATGRCPAFEPERFWTHSLLTAVLAQRFERLVRWEDESPGLGYLCGLMHALGLLAVVHLEPEEMRAVFAALSSGEYTSLRAAEEALIGITHDHAGARLADIWKLPRALAVVMTHHHDPEYRGEHWELNSLVAAASFAAATLMDSDDREAEAVDAEVAGLLGLEAARNAVATELDAARGALDEIATLASQLSAGDRS